MGTNPDNLNSFQHKTHKTEPLGLTYSYYLSPNFHDGVKAHRPVLMLLHGYPDDAFMWAGAVPTLLKLPYPIIIPELLGFGGTDKPIDKENYKYRLQVNSLAQVLEAEGVTKSVIPIGHDWGSATAQRFYLYHKEKCIGLTLLSLAYQVPSDKTFDLDTANEVTAKRFGYPQWEYWNFFTAPDGARLMEENLDRFWEVNNGFYPSPLPEENGRDIWMREMFCVPNGMREYITQTGRWKGKLVELHEYGKDEKLKQRFKERLSRDGLQGPVNYYHTLANNSNLEDEKKYLCKNKEAMTIEVPLLYIGMTGDWVCRTDLMVDAKQQGLIANSLDEKAVEAAHWCLYDQAKSDEIAGHVSKWLSTHFAVQ